MESFLRVGIITGTHGVQGELKVFPTTDDKQRFEALSELLLAPSEDAARLHVTSVRYHKDRVLLCVDEIRSPEEGARLSQQELYIPRSQAVPLEENENYVADLVGMRVISDQGEDLGVLSRVFFTGANDVYEITDDNKKQRLLPAIPDVILSVDVEEQRMIVHLFPEI